ncbi:hypothetical protein JL722_5931 [Aureococcus anophagefferens]|nr:hypothetical protein JL722_5931 [Aureococcus anophagefferens]
MAVARGGSRAGGVGAGGAAPFWGVFGVTAMLLNAVRLRAVALEPFGGAADAALVCAYGAAAASMAYAEGYKAFHLKFSPMVVKRSLTLRDAPLAHKATTVNAAAATAAVAARAAAAGARARARASARRARRQRREPRQRDLGEAAEAQARGHADVLGRERREANSSAAPARRDRAERLAAERARRRGQDAACAWSVASSKTPAPDASASTEGHASTSSRSPSTLRLAGLQPHLHAVRAHRHHDARARRRPDDYSTLDDYQLPMRRRLEDGESLGVLGLGSGDLNLFERAGFVVPFDWECQTGTSGGVYPCPNGIPSTCRANTGGVSSVCAKCYCESGSHTCCTYYNESNTYSEDGYWYGGFECPSALLSGGELVTDSAVNYCEVGDAVSALFDGGESYSANVTEVTGSDITVTYSDDDTSTYDLTESGNVSYINFKVTRYEMADAFGVEFYSTEGDTLKVFSTGGVHFKPDNAERTVYINEQVEYGRETDVDRRLSTAEAVLGTSTSRCPSTTRLVEARYRPATRGGSQKPAAASEVPARRASPSR